MSEVIERADVGKEFLDALNASRNLIEFAIAKDNDGVFSSANTVYPKLRFVFANINRYLFATRYISGNEFVIDAPCGTGYGSALLGSTGCGVLGIDIDESVIASNLDKYRYPNLDFVCGDITKTPIPTADVIVCFEGLEHVTPGAILIERFVGALNDGGKLILSVPINEKEISGVDNPYHLEDYDLEKLDSLLSKYFSKIFYFGNDIVGGISDVSFAFDGIIAVCEVS